MHRLLLVTVAAIVSAGMPAFADDARDCFQHQQPQLRIKGCSEIIQRDPNDATAYHNRAVVYELSGDIDRAIALKPTVRSCFAARTRNAVMSSAVVARGSA